MVVMVGRGGLVQRPSRPSAHRHTWLMVVVDAPGLCNRPGATTIHLTLVCGFNLTASGLPRPSDKGVVAECPWQRPSAWRGSAFSCLPLLRPAYDCVPAVDVVLVPDARLPKLHLPPRNRNNQSIPSFVLQPVASRHFNSVTNSRPTIRSTGPLN